MSFCKTFLASFLAGLASKFLPSIVLGLLRSSQFRENLFSRCMLLYAPMSFERRNADEMLNTFMDKCADTQAEYGTGWLSLILIKEIFQVVWYASISRISYYVELTLISLMFCITLAIYNRTGWVWGNIQKTILRGFAFVTKFSVQ